MSTLEVGKIVPATGTAVTLGDSGDTFTIPASATLTIAGTINASSGTATGFGLFESYALIVDSKADGVDGGTFTLGAWRTRDLQTEVYDGIGITISSNEFTLPTGNYFIQWSAPALIVGFHQTRLYDITGTAAIQDGSSEESPYGLGSNRSTGFARVTPSGSNVYRIEHRCDVTNSTNGFGVSVAYGETIIFTIVEIFKES